MPGGDDNRRGSDRVIKQLRQEFHQHKEEEEAWRAGQDLRWTQLDKNWTLLVDATTKSAECQIKNTEAIDKLVESTGDMVQTYRDFQGVTRIGKGVQSFCLFLLKWGFIGTSLVAMIHFVISYFSDKPIT
jgi:hypothetical protein